MLKENKNCRVLQHSTKHSTLYFDWCDEEKGIDISTSDNKPDFGAGGRSARSFFSLEEWELKILRDFLNEKFGGTND